MIETYHYNHGTLEIVCIVLLPYNIISSFLKCFIYLKGGMTEKESQAHTRTERER